jgi:hypothetical protein
MPLYDFCCVECAGEREVQAGLNQVGSLELICVGCGGVMKKALRKTATFVMSSTARSSPPPARPPLPRRDTCSDGAVKLTRANPFARSLPSLVDGAEGR